MTRLLYCNIDSLQDHLITSHLRVFPESIRREIARYRNPADQKTRLLGKLMLQHTLKNEGRHDLLQQLQRDQHNKPFIKNWDFFNISHASNMVVFCYGKKIVGVDLERIGKVDDVDTLRYLHPEEQDYITTSKCIEFAFYEIWVKKEALLKATGTGIVDGLNEFSCIENKVHFRGSDWYLTKIDLQQEYLCYVCHQDPETEIMMAKFDSFI